MDQAQAVLVVGLFASHASLFDEHENFVDLQGSFTI